MWGKTEQVLTSGKNLIDINSLKKYEVDNRDIKASIDNDKVILEGKGTKTSEVIFFCLNKTDDLLKLNPGKYTISFKSNMPMGTANESKTVEIFAIIKKADGSSAYSSTGNKEWATFDIAEGDMMYLRFDINNGTMSAEFYDIQLEYGSSPTAYEPYTGGRPSPSPDYPQPIEITDQPVTVTIKGGTEQQSITLTPPKPMTKWDKLEKVDGVWCWVYQTKKYTVTGEEVFTKGGDSYIQGSSTSFYTSKNIGDPVGADSSLMNRLTKNERVWSKPGEIGYVINANQLHMRFLNTTLGVSDDATEVEKKTAYVNYLKAEYAKGTPYELLYAVKKSELIPLSPSEQAQLNALTMYAGTTEVTNTGGCNMELTYTVDTKSYVDSKIAAISAAVLEV